MSNPKSHFRTAPVGLRLNRKRQAGVFLIVFSVFVAMASAIFQPPLDEWKIVGLPFGFFAISILVPIIVCIAVVMANYWAIQYDIQHDDEN